MTYDWQKHCRLSRPIKKGDVVVFDIESRGSGKSMFAQNMMEMKFASAWTKWKGTWTWKPMVSTHTGKMIWGNIMVRENKLMLSSHGRRITEHVSPKEALAQQREEFKEILSRG